MRKTIALTVKLDSSNIMARKNSMCNKYSISIAPTAVQSKWLRDPPVATGWCGESSMDAHLLGQIIGARQSKLERLKELI